MSVTIQKNSSFTIPSIRTAWCTWRCATRSFIQPTNTRGTSGASPNVFNNNSFTWCIISKDCREIILNTNTYPFTPNDAFRDNREYSSCLYYSLVWLAIYLYQHSLDYQITHFIVCVFSNTIRKNENKIRTIPAVSTISVAKWTFRKRIVLW